MLFLLPIRQTWTPAAASYNLFPSMSMNKQPSFHIPRIDIVLIRCLETIPFLTVDASYFPTAYLRILGSRIRHMQEYIFFPSMSPLLLSLTYASSSLLLSVKRIVLYSFASLRHKSIQRNGDGSLSLILRCRPYICLKSV